MKINALSLIFAICYFISSLGCTGGASSKKTKDTDDGEGEPTANIAEELYLQVSVSGLGNSPLVLEESTAGNLTIEADGTHTFPNQVDTSTEIAILATQQPNDTYCDLSAATGTFAEGLAIAITCVPAIIPESFTYELSQYVFMNGYADREIDVPPAYHYSLASYSVSPDLPAGLSLDPTTGTISGTPSGTAVETQHTFTQTNHDGSTKTTQMKLKVLDGFLVDSLEDIADDSPGTDGCKATGATGPTQCTLRAAIEEANVNIDENVIYFDGTHNLTVGARMEILHSVAIIGGSEDTAIIDAAGNNSRRVFHTNVAGKILTFINFTIQNVVTANEGNEGGAIRVNNSPMYVSHVTTKDGDCTTNEDGCGIYLDNASDFIIEYSTFSGNQSTWDAGVWAHNSVGKVMYTTFFDNEAASGGGAMSVTGASATVEFIGCTFENNRTTSGFGAALNAVDSGPTVTVRNTTFKNNDAVGEGGALNARDNSSVTVYNSAFVDNDATVDGAAIFAESAASVNVYNSYFANNMKAAVTDHCFIDSGASALLHLTNNIFDELDTNNCTLTTDVGNLVSANFNLGDFAFHGGTVKAYMPELGSPLIDAADVANCEEFDARGYQRPVDGDSTAGALCDIGPIEFRP